MEDNFYSSIPADKETLRMRLELRRSSAASPHVDKYRQNKKGFGKGGRQRFNVKDFRQ